MLMLPILRLSILIVLGLSLLSGCQLIELKENQLSSSLAQKTDSILTNQKLSESTRQLLSLEAIEIDECLKNIDQCTAQLHAENTLDKEQVYSAVSELYLSKALGMNDSKHCQAVRPSAQCLTEQLGYLDKSLRNSFVYLFYAPHTPVNRIFDLRQAQVRTFYNVALSQIVLKTTHSAEVAALKPNVQVGTSIYAVDTTLYQSLTGAKISQIQSSYNLNFTGLDRINRQEGIGAEFVVKKVTTETNNQTFILDPESFYQGKTNPNIREPRYLALSTVAIPAVQNATAELVLSGQTPFKIQFVDPNIHKTANIHGQNYTLSANYSVPFGLWLSENKLGTAGYWTLLNREERLQMPHLFKLEPYQPNKKIIVMIHGLASSPETWVSLTNNIMGDPKLRENYQVWQVFYSTNMPIFESRFQINTLLKQAFAQVEANSVSSQNAVLIGHSMGGVISRLLVSDADISAKAIPLLNYEQNIQLQRNPVIRDRFVFQPLAPFSRAIFIAAPHRGSNLAETWYVNIAKKLVKLPVNFFDQVDIHLNAKNSTQGMIHSGPDDLRPSSRFMTLTENIEPKPSLIYHSIIGNATKSNDKQKMSDGIVPYASSHLAGAASESVLKGGHSIHAEPETLIELRHILHEHLDKMP